jgi:alkylated DNA repair protein alkB family protein 8
VQHYGYEFKYGANNVNVDEKMGLMPPFLKFLEPKLAKIMSHFEVKEGVNKHGDQCKKVTFKNEPVADNILTSFGYFDQMTANDYMPGQGIPPHVDTHSPFQEVFAAISLKSGTTMHFKDPQSKVLDLYLEPRTLMVFSGEARYNWLHSIAQRKIDRVDDLLRFR